MPTICGFNDKQHCKFIVRRTLGVFFTYVCKSIRTHDSWNKHLHAQHPYFWHDNQPHLEHSHSSNPLRHNVHCSRPVPPVVHRTFRNAFVVQLSVCGNSVRPALGLSELRHLPSLKPGTRKTVFVCFPLSLVNDALVLLRDSAE